MRIAIVGPAATEDLSDILCGQTQTLPRGYIGAPFVATLAQELLHRGHEVAVVTTDAALPWQGGTVHATQGRFSIGYVPQRARAFRPSGARVGRAVDLFRLERRAIVSELARIRPDVVHAHWAYEFGWAAIDSGLPHVVTCHDSPLVIARHARSAYRWVRAAMAWHVMRRARCVSAVSPYMCREAQRWARVPVHLVPNPLPSLVFEIIRKPATAPRARVAMAGSGWSAFKNPQAGLRAFALLRERMPTVELNAFGADFGPGEVAERWARSRDLHHGVVFRGRVPHAEFLNALADCDLLLHSSLEESFGAVLAEAQALGVVVVAGRSSGAAPWVVGDCGRLVDVTEPDQMAHAMFELLEEPARRTALGERARQRMREEFGVHAIAMAYEGLYALARASATAF